MLTYNPFSAGVGSMAPQAAPRATSSRSLQLLSRHPGFHGSVAVTLVFMFRSACTQEAIDSSSRGDKRGWPQPMWIDARKPTPRRRKLAWTGNHGCQGIPWQVLLEPERPAGFACQRTNDKTWSELDCNPCEVYLFASVHCAGPAPSLVITTYDGLEI